MVRKAIVEPTLATGRRSAIKRDMRTAFAKLSFPGSTSMIRSVNGRPLSHVSATVCSVVEAPKLALAASTIRKLVQ